jgi:hypothetical protein
MKYSEPSPCSDRCLGVRICVSVNPQARVKRALVLLNTHPRGGLVRQIGIPWKEEPILQVATSGSGYRGLATCKHPDGEA